MVLRPDISSGFGFGRDLRLSDTPSSASGVSLGRSTADPVRSCTPGDLGHSSVALTGGKTHRNREAVFLNTAVTFVHSPSPSVQRCGEPALLEPLLFLLRVPPRKACHPLDSQDRIRAPSSCRRA